MTIRPRIQRCFVAWLEHARPRLAIQPRVTKRHDRMLTMTFDGLTPAIGAGLSRYDIDVWVVRDGICWDLVFSEYVQTGGRNGARVCLACPPDARVPYPTREALWREHLFESFLTWINTALARATGLALYRDDGMTWVKLLPDDTAQETERLAMVIPPRDQTGSAPP